MKLPRLPAVQGPDALKVLWQFANDVVEYLRFLPDLEYKKITTVANFPIFVSSRVENIVEVRRVQTYVTKDSSQVIEDTSIGWRLSPDTKQPGVYITALGGLTQGTGYTVMLAIQGAQS